MKPNGRRVGSQIPGLGRVIASRILSEQDVPETKVIVSIGLPRPHPRQDWECPFLIEGIGESKVRGAYGVDAMQSLISALQGIRAGLDQSERALFWLDPKRGTFFPVMVSTAYGKRFEDRVGLAIEREMVREWRAIIKSRREIIRAHEAKLRRQGVAPSKIARSVAEGKRDLDEWESEIRTLKPGWSRPVLMNEGRKGAKERARSRTSR